MKIRIATNADLDELLKLEQMLIAHERPHDRSLKQNEKITYYDLPALLKSDDAEIFIADNNGEIIATGYGLIKDNASKYTEAKYGYIGFIYVKEIYRRQGIAEKILEYLFKWFREKEINEVMLRVYDSNQGAVRLYEKLGFQKGLVEMKLNFRDMTNG